MTPTGARGPPGRGAPRPAESRPAMDRTASLPNLEAAGSSNRAASIEIPARRRDTAQNNGGRQSEVDELASPVSPTVIYGAPNMCRRVPTQAPIPTGRTSTVRTPENNFSTVSPTTRMSDLPKDVRMNASLTRTDAQPSRPVALNKTTTSAALPLKRTDTNRPKLAPILMPQPTARAPNVRASTSHAGTRANQSARSNTDTRRQTARQSSEPMRGSPAPPRTAAYDSPALRFDQSSQSGSTMSLTSDGHKADLEDLMTPISPSPSMECEYLQESRAQRRRRSPEEEIGEEAKRYRLEAISRSGNSPTYAEAARRTPSPRTSAQSQVPTQRATGTTLPTSQINPAPDTAASGNVPAKKKRPRYPPLVVEKLPNWATHFKAIAAKLGHPPNARPYGQGVRFSPESEEEYRVVQRYLTTLEKECSISWFAYSLPAEKKLKVAIRGLPPDTEPQEIEEELRSLGYEPEYVRHINARQGRPGCVFHAVLAKTENVRAIYDTSIFMMMRGVKIEAWRGKRGPAQCHRCQQFRHSSHQCHRPLACVRCGEGHVARECPRPREEPATCANCGGPHPANNIRCPIYQKEIQHRRVGTAAITVTTTRRPQKPTEAATTMAAKTQMNVTTFTSTQPIEEAQGASLMAAANGPTQRGEAASSSGRRRKKRGSKSTKLAPIQNQEEENEKHQNNVPATNEAQARNQVKVSTNGASYHRRHLVAENITKNCVDQSAATSEIRPTNRNTAESQNKSFTACAIKLLMELIKAIRQGQDVEQVILDGLAALLTLYHG